MLGSGLRFPVSRWKTFPLDPDAVSGSSRTPCPTWNIDIMKKEICFLDWFIFCWIKKIKKTKILADFFGSFLYFYLPSNKYILDIQLVEKVYGNEWRIHKAFHVCRNVLPETTIIRYILDLLKRFPITGRARAERGIGI